MSNIHTIRSTLGENINAGYKFSDISKILEEIVYNSIDADSSKIIIRYR